MKWVYIHPDRDAGVDGHWSLRSDKGLKHTNTIVGMGADLLAAGEHAYVLPYNGKLRARVPACDDEKDAARDFEPHQVEEAKAWAEVEALTLRISGEA